MTKKNKGFLYYAHNNEIINYLRLAICSALTARHQLKDFHAMVVTDKYSLESLTEQDNELLEELFEFIKVDNTVFERKNYKGIMHGYENKGKHPWYNRTRPNAYKDSVYDETILIDVDFIFQDNNLDKLWGSETPLMMAQETIPLINTESAERTSWPKREMLSNFTIPLYWATVVYFQKGDFAKEFFNKVNHIHENYSYYKELYQMQGETYRNDNSFSIALHMMNGFIISGPEFEIPHKFIMTTTMDLVYRIDKESAKFILHSRDWKNPWHLFNVKNISYHCLDKVSLLMKYEQFLEIYANTKSITTEQIIEETLKEVANG